MESYTCFLERLRYYFCYNQCIALFINSDIYKGDVTMTQIIKTLTIAGSDSSGGAGIQADLKTFEEYGTYGFSALTTIVTMDPDNGWHHNVYQLTPPLLLSS